MKCQVPGANVKVFARAVHALARFGDELYLEFLPDSILLKTINAAESAYTMVKFNKKNFFKYNYYSTEDNEVLKCKISMNPALHIFKLPNQQVENLKIQLDSKAWKLIFQFKCKHGIVKTHYVSILDSKALQAVYAKDSVPNRITSSQRILSEALRIFHSSDDLITLEATSQSLILRNYIDTSDILIKLRSQIRLNPAEFDNYVIGAETTISFPMKEYRALLAFAEALSLPIQLHFDTTGCPAIFVVQHGSKFEAHFVLATCKPDDATQATSTKNSSTIRKRKDSSIQPAIDNESARNKVHIDAEISKCLEQDLDLFSLIDIPEDVQNGCDGQNGSVINNANNSNVIDCDNIPASLTSKTLIKTVFTRCFESTYDPRAIRGVVIVESSDSE